MNSSSLLWWLLRPKGNTLHFSWWLLRPKGKKGVLSATSETADKKEEMFEFSNLKGLYARAYLSRESFESFWFPSFWEKKENRSYLLLFSLEKLFSVYTTQLTRCAASSTQKRKQNNCKCGLFLGMHTTPLTRLAASSMQLRSKKTQTFL